MSDTILFYGPLVSDFLQIWCGTISGWSQENPIKISLKKKTKKTNIVRTIYFKSLGRPLIHLKPSGPVALPHCILTHTLQNSPSSKIPKNKLSLLHYFIVLKNVEIVDFLFFVLMIISLFSISECLRFAVRKE